MRTSFFLWSNKYFNRYAIIFWRIRVPFCEVYDEIKSKTKTKTKNMMKKKETIRFK